MSANTTLWENGITAQPIKLSKKAKIGRTTILNKADLSAKNVESLSKIILAATNMKDIVNSVKNLYAIEIGKKQIEFEQVELANILLLLKKT